jgi:hypothetical protein
MSRRRSKGTAMVPAMSQVDMSPPNFQSMAGGALANVGAEKAQAVSATTPQFVGLGSQFTSPRKGVRELLRLYRESPWLRAIVGKVGHSVADTEWYLVANKNSSGRFVADPVMGRSHGAKRERLVKAAVAASKAERIESHPLLTLLKDGTGNPRLNGHAVLQITQQHLDLVGEAFWIKERDRLGIPVAVWPVPPSWVSKLPNEESPFYRVTGPGGMQVLVPVTEVVPFVDADPENPYGRGVGTASSLDDEIQIDEFAAKHQKAFFLNRARPDIIISGQFLSKPDSERLEKQWLSDHQGFWKAFKPLFFSQKIDIKELSQSFEQMQMVQIRKAERDTFISVFGAPPEKFGIIGESKRSTIQAADYFWNKDVIKPRVEAIARVLQQVLVPSFDPRLILTYDTPVLQDDDYRLEVMKAAPWAFTIDDWREEGSRPVLPNDLGQALIIPMNMVVNPLKDGLETPEPVTPQAMAENHRKSLALRGPQVEVDTSGIAQSVASAVAQALASSLDEIKSKVTRLEHQPAA